MSETIIISVVVAVAGNSNRVKTIVKYWYCFRLITQLLNNLKITLKKQKQYWTYTII